MKNNSLSFLSLCILLTYILLLGNIDPYNYPEFGKYENCLRWPQNQNVISPYSARLWSRMSRRNNSQVRDSPIKVILENKGLMERFNKHCTEMIITKTGR